MSLVRLTYDMVHRTPNPILGLMSAWGVLSIGLIDALVYVRSTSSIVPYSRRADVPLIRSLGFGGVRGAAESEEEDARSDGMRAMDSRDNDYILYKTDGSGLIN